MRKMLKRLLLRKEIEEMRRVLDIQGDNGNWNYDYYMQGMYNGMEFMLSIVEEREPKYKGAPDKWVSSKENHESE
jgi:hypothetical protein